MTRNLKLFAVFSLVWSVIFYSALHWCLFDPDKRWPLVLVASISYGVGFSIAGHLLGKTDSENHKRRNLLEGYLATSCIASILVGSIWVFGFRPNEIGSLLLTVFLTALGLAIAIWATRKHTIKGIPKKELFR